MAHIIFIYRPNCHTDGSLEWRYAALKTDHSFNCNIRHQGHTIMYRRMQEGRQSVKERESRKNYNRKVCRLKLRVQLDHKNGAEEQEETKEELSDDFHTVLGKNDVLDVVSAHGDVVGHQKRQEKKNVSGGSRYGGKGSRQPPLKA